MVTKVDSDQHTVVDMSNNIIVIEADTGVKFTGVDSVFDTEHPEESHLEKKSTAETETQEAEVIDEVKFIDAPPEPMDDFDDLNVVKDEALPMDFDEQIS